MVVLLLITAIVTPYRISFVDTSSLLWDLIDYTFDLLFGVDIIVSFLSAYVDEKNKVVTDWKMIWTQYIKGWLFIDLIAM